MGPSVFASDLLGDRWDASHGRGTANGIAKIKVTNVTGARTSGETRPKNIRVTYIMKVY